RRLAPTGAPKACTVGCSDGLGRRCTSPKPLRLKRRVFLKAAMARGYTCFREPPLCLAEELQRHREFICCCRPNVGAQRRRAARSAAREGEPQAAMPPKANPSAAATGY